jgi:hypothetical protein
MLSSEADAGDLMGDQRGVPTGSSEAGSATQTGVTRAPPWATGPHQYLGRIRRAWIASGLRLRTKQALIFEDALLVVKGSTLDGFSDDSAPTDPVSAVTTIALKPVVKGVTKRGASRMEDLVKRSSLADWFESGRVVWAVRAPEIRGARHDSGLMSDGLAVTTLDGGKRQVRWEAPPNPNAVALSRRLLGSKLA